MNFRNFNHHSPKSLKREDFRFYIFLSYAYIFAFLFHLTFLVPLYTMLNLPVAFISDIACIIADVICIILIRREKINSSFILFLSVVTVHTTLSIIFFGSSSCLFLYYFTLVVITFFSHWKTVVKIAVASFFTALAIGLTTYSYLYAPVSEITRNQFLFWNCGNILLNSFTLGAGIYYFSLIVDTAEEKLRYQADHDLLTGILNRKSIISVLKNAMARSNNGEVSVILCDIDYFKNINDTYGHLVGDEVLRAVTGILGRSLREGDALGRFGGEEFIIVLPGCALSPAIKIAERKRAFLSAKPVSTSTGDINVRVSFGVASMQGDSQDVESFIHRADQALYRAKNNGRNRVEFCEKSLLCV